MKTRYKTSEALFNDCKISYSMKYFVIFLIVAVGFGLFAINNIAYGFQESKSFYDLYYENELLVKGTIISSANNPLNEELTGYNVEVIEQYSKPQQSFNLITAFDPLNTQSFDVDDTVFLYLNKIDNVYMISPYSFKIPANCGELSFTGLSYLPWQNPPRSSPAGISLEIVDLQGNQEQLLEVGIGYIIQTGKFWHEPTDQLDLEIIIQNTDTNEIVFQEQKTHYGDPCNWKDVKWHLTFDNAGHYTAFIIKHEQLFADKIVRPSIVQTVEFTVGIDDESLSKISMINPSLKEQMNLGLPIDAMYCRNDLVLIQKYNGSPACVTESTKQKLVERGWTENISSYREKTDNQNMADEVDKRPILDHDSLMAEIEKGIPGFGGVFVRDDGVMTIYVDPKTSEPSQTLEERKAIMESYMDHHSLNKGLAVIEAQYTVSELLAVKNQLTSLLEQNQGITMIGIGDTKNRVLVGIETTDTEDQVRAELTRLGISDDIIHIIETGKFRIGGAPININP